MAKSFVFTALNPEINNNPSFSIECSTFSDRQKELLRRKVNEIKPDIADLKGADLETQLQIIIGTVFENVNNTIHRTFETLFDEDQNLIPMINEATLSQKELLRILPFWYVRKEEVGFYEYSVGRKRVEKKLISDTLFSRVASMFLSYQSLIEPIIIGGPKEELMHKYSKPLFIDLEDNASDIYNGNDGVEFYIFTKIYKKQETKSLFDSINIQTKLQGASSIFSRDDIDADTGYIKKNKAIQQGGFIDDFGIDTGADIVEMFTLADKLRFLKVNDDILLVINITNEYGRRFFEMFDFLEFSNELADDVKKMTLADVVPKWNKDYTYTPLNTGVKRLFELTIRNGIFHALNRTDMFMTKVARYREIVSKDEELQREIYEFLIDYFSSFAPNLIPDTVASILVSLAYPIMPVLKEKSINFINLLFGHTELGKTSYAKYIMRLFPSELNYEIEGIDSIVTPKGTLRKLESILYFPFLLDENIETNTSKNEKNIKLSIKSLSARGASEQSSKDGKNVVMKGIKSRAGFVPTEEAPKLESDMNRLVIKYMGLKQKTPDSVSWKEFEEIAEEIVDRMPSLKKYLGDDNVHIDEYKYAVLGFFLNLIPSYDELLELKEENEFNKHFLDLFETFYTKFYIKENNIFIRWDVLFKELRKPIKLMRHISYLFYRALQRDEIHTLILNAMQLYIQKSKSKILLPDNFVYMTRALNIEEGSKEFILGMMLVLNRDSLLYWLYSITLGDLQLHRSFKQEIQNNMEQVIYEHQFAQIISDEELAKHSNNNIYLYKKTFKDEDPVVYIFNRDINDDSDIIVGSKVYRCFHNSTYAANMQGYSAAKVIKNIKQYLQLVNDIVLTTRDGRYGIYLLLPSIYFFLFRNLLNEISYYSGKNLIKEDLYLFEFANIGKVDPGLVIFDNSEDALRFLDLNEKINADQNIVKFETKV